MRFSAFWFTSSMRKNGKDKNCHLYEKCTLGIIQLRGEPPCSINPIKTFGLFRCDSMRKNKLTMRQSTISHKVTLSAYRIIAPTKMVLTKHYLVTVEIVN